ncbi:hypothetical protein IJJ18_00695 [Candidatus Saccharibacteria bacterium]|nr:hypothetical protein [Candidatus Saccharibacteria bacterium]
MTTKKKTIICIIIAGVIVATLGTILLINILSRPAIKTEWGKTYYGYIKEQTKDGNDLGIIDGTKSDMRFIELEGQKDPAMVISHRDDNNNPRANIYFIQNNTVNALVYTQITQVVFLYNISIQKYDYYLHVTVDGKDIYKSLSKLLAENPENNDTKTLTSDADYVFEESDTEKVTTDEGEEVEVSKYDQTFIEPTTPENSTPFNPDMSDSEIASAIVTTESEYQTQEEIVSEEVKEAVEQKTQEVKERHEQVEKIKEQQSLTNENVSEKLSEGLKWIYGLDMGSLFGLDKVYEYRSKDPGYCQSIGLPKNSYTNEYNCRELVGAGSIANMKNTALKYLSESVFTQLKGDTVLHDHLYDAAGQVYFVFQGGGVGGVGFPTFNASTARVLNSDGGKSTVSWPVYRESFDPAKSGELYKNFTLGVEYQSGQFKITSVQ